MKPINLNYELLKQHNIREKMYNEGKEEEFCGLPPWAVQQIHKYNHQQWLFMQPDLKFKCSKTGKIITIEEPTFRFYILSDGKVEYSYQVPLKVGKRTYAEEIDLTIVDNGTYKPQTAFTFG